MSQNPRLIAAVLAAMLLPVQVGAPLAQGIPGGAKGAPYAPPAEVKPDGTPALAGANDPAAPLPTAEELQLAADDPPSLVGRVARGEGRATLRLPGAEDWQTANLNTAVTEGTAIWTEPGGRLALDVGQNRMFLDGASALQLDELQDDGVRATLAQGSVFLRSQGLGGDYGGLLEVATPEAQLATAVDGRYLIEAAGEGRPGRIAVFEGAAEVTPAGGQAVQLAAGDALVFVPGAEPQRVAAGASVPLMAWALAAEPRRPIPEAARGMTGIVDLAAVGRWDRSPDYGDVWYPPVQQDWQPYRDGNWEWREPWGWTWVDAAPWGFAPAHYGRWVQVGPRWAWAPQPVRVVGPRVRPVWAPALVAFFGGGGGYGAGRPVGWVPLAPREPYYPWYRASPRYVQRVNVRQVVNVVNVRNVWVQQGGDRRWNNDDRRRDPNWARFHDRRLDQFRNRRAALQVEERVMRDSLPVRREARALRVEDSRRAELTGGLPIRPGAGTRGLTDRGADRFGVPREAIRRPDADRGAPPPRVREALAERRRDVRRDDVQERREDARERRDDARDDAARAERERDLRERQLEQQRRAQQDPQQRGPDRADRLDRPDADRPDRPDVDRPDRAARPDDTARRQRIEALRQQQQDQLRERQGQARQPGEPRAAQQDEPRRQQIEQLRRQQQDQARQQREQQRERQEGLRQRQQPDQPGGQQDDARRQQQEQARQQREQQQQRQQDQRQRQQADQPGDQRDDARRQQIEQMRRQQQEQTRQQQEQRQRQQQDQQRGQVDDGRRQQQEQARQQQQEQARQQQEQARQQQRAQQQEQARQQQEQARQQQRAQQQEQARQQQEQARQQQRAQQQEQARQQQEQARQQQRAQQQEQARQQQEQARQQQRAQQQEQARQQQEQARQQQRAQQEQARQQQSEQRRQERQQQRQQ